MRPLIEPTSLEHLTEQVQQIENRRGTEPSACVASGWAEMDQTLGGGLPRGMVHEWFGQHTPPLTIVGHLAGRALLDQPAGWAVWIGAEIWPYPQALIQPFTTEDTENTERKQREGKICHLPFAMCDLSLGTGVNVASSAQWRMTNGKSQMADSSLSSSSVSSVLSVVNRSFWLDPATEDERLWSIDQALRCPAVTTVIADGRGLNMAATRRLQLAAKTGGALAMLLRADSEQAELSAAALRWRVIPACSPNRHPRWTVELLRHKGHALNGPQRTWLVERNRAQGLVDLSAQLRHRPGAAEDERRRIA